MMLRTAGFVDNYALTGFVRDTGIRRDQIQAIVAKGERIYLFWWE